MIQTIKWNRNATKFCWQEGASEHLPELCGLGETPAVAGDSVHVCQKIEILTFLTRGQ